MILVPWTTDTGEIITNELGETIFFSIDASLEFLTNPTLTVEVGFLYNYDIACLYSETIIASEKPSELTFTELTPTTANLSGVFSEVGSYDVVLSAFDSNNIEIQQRFTINVTDKYNTEDIDTDERFNSLGDTLLLLFEQVSWATALTGL